MLSSYLSESDVCHKVFTLLLALFPYCKKEFLVRTKPSFKCHPTFTDFLINDGEEKCIIIEVKDVLLSCDLTIPCDEVVQVLRQAQIVIQHFKVNDVTCVFTNSHEWSFGMVKKKGNKIEVAWTTHFHVVAYPEELVKVYQVFKNLLTS